MTNFIHSPLVFHDVDVRPTEVGDYVIYNQCDGYHVVEGFADEDGEVDFIFFGESKPVQRDFYCAWAKLPNSFFLHALFSRKAGE